MPEGNHGILSTLNEIDRRSGNQTEGMLSAALSIESAAQHRYADEKTPEPGRHEWWRCRSFHDKTLKAVYRILRDNRGDLWHFGQRDQDCGCTHRCPHRINPV